MIGMAVGEDDVGNPFHGRGFVGHEGGIAGKERIDQDALPAKSRRNAEWPYQVICMNTSMRGKTNYRARRSAPPMPAAWPHEARLRKPPQPLVDAFAALPSRGALLGLDLGTKTIGVAASDPDRRMATSVETISRKNFSTDAARMLTLAQERSVVGLGARPADEYGRQRRSPRAVDPRFRPQPCAADAAAHRFLGRAIVYGRRGTRADRRGHETRRRAEVIDQHAAVFILQGALDRLAYGLRDVDQLRPPPPPPPPASQGRVRP